jgi:pimeloyl-ACP methyl ester carboxylesterase
MEKLAVVVFGLAMRYSAVGNPGDPVILYIHGNLGSGVWYERVMDVPGYRTIAPDMPNFGMSDVSGDYSVAGYARAVSGFLDELGVEKCTIVGHSLGGVVAMELAATRPELIERLLLVSPGPIEGLKTPESHYPAIERYKTDRAFLKAGLQAVTPSLRDEDFLDRLTEMGSRMDPGAFIGHPEELGKADFRGRLGTLPFPTMLLRGEADIIITEDMAARTAAHLGAEPVGMPGCGHSPMVERPAEFLGILKAFLKKEP